MNFEKFQAINDARMNVGELDHPSVVHSFTNEGCGDDYTVFLAVEDDIIRDASFTSNGCGFGMAAFALATEWVKGKTTAEALRITAEEVGQAVDGFPVRRLHYPQAAARVLRETIESYLASAPQLRSS
jgi:NifU-like protein involved in Fe-S cluster formation